MKWYAASVLIYTKFKDEKQDMFPIWENIILISANTPEEALEKAKQRALQDQGDSSGTLECNGRPATWVFAGIRKLIECEDLEKRPDDGTEITYNKLIIKKQKDFDKFLKGEPVTVYYEE